MTDKTALRAQMAERRANAQVAQPLAGLTLSARPPREALPSPGAVVAGYWPFRSEIDPRPLMRRLMLHGCRIVLPVTPPKGDVGPLAFHPWTPDAVLRPHAVGMQEPHGEGAGEAPTLLLVPLLAFDRQGGRLGYGAGHYDRTLEALRRQGPVTAIGLAFAVQEADALPTEAHDQPLDAVLTERAYIPITPGAL